MGDLMHDFGCNDPNQMKYEMMAEGARYWKENPKGVELMCKAMEDMRNEAMQKGMEKGETRFGLLATMLVSSGRAAEVARAASDTDYRGKLYNEFRIS